MKEIEEELVVQINNVFDNYDDELSEQGWQELRLKYPEKPAKRLPIWWISGIAAAILIAFGLFLIKDSPITKDDMKPMVKNDSAKKPRTNNSLKQDIAKTQKTDINKEVNQQHNTAKPVENTVISKSNEVLQPKQKEEAIIINPTIKKDNQPASIDHKVNRIAQGKVIAQQPDSIDKKNQPLIANKVNPVEMQNPTLAANKNTKPIVKEPTVTKKTTEEFLNDQSKILGQKAKKSKSTNNIRNSFDVYTGTFLNYYADNDTKVNAGFGVNANLKVSKNLVVSLGAGISQNKITYKNGFPESNLSYANVSMAAGLNTVVSPVKASAQLLNLDIPILLKFYPTKKQNFYLTTGINSNTYLSQKYTSAFSMTSLNAFGISQTQNQEQTEKSKLKGFDFGTSAIFGFGINQHIGKNNLIFEPYFKPAIGTMGDKNLRINAVGLNLRFNFSSANKN